MEQHQIRRARIVIDADSAGENLKRVICDDLMSAGVDVVDLRYAQTHPESGDYPDVAVNLATQIRDKKFDRGILICGTGLGMAMCACKVPGVYAGTCHDVYSAERLRKSNNAQIITLGERVVGPELAKTIIRAWLESEFAGGGSTPKVSRMHELEAGLLRTSGKHGQGEGNATDCQ
jgi:ribose 5-phosphate isomerase B